MNAKDFKYISQKFNIPPPTLKKITEEEKDVNLLLDSLSVGKIQNTDAKFFNYLTYLKLIVFRYSYDTNFDIEEKIYVASCIYCYYLKIKKCLDFKLLMSKNISEERSQYYLILAGFYYDRVTMKLFPENYETIIQDGFKLNTTLKELNIHVKDWIYILREIYRKNWLCDKGR